MYPTCMFLRREFKKVSCKEILYNFSTWSILSLILSKKLNIVKFDSMKIYNFKYSAFSS